MLDVRGTYVSALPQTIIKLQKLQYIHAGRKSVYTYGEPSSLMERCVTGACLCATCCPPILLDIGGPFHKALTRRDACTFACCVEFLAQLREVVVKGAVMVPRGIRKLKGLHTLRKVNVGSRGGAVLRDIGMLTGLRNLGVAGINKKNGPAFHSAISNLSKLESLFVRAETEELGFRGCLDGTFSPPENLQSLKLDGKLETLPEWIEGLHHLVKLKLMGTRPLEHDAAMELLGKLPKLEILCLYYSQPFQVEEIDFKSRQAGIAFENLRVLSLEGITKVKSVKFERGTMPNLERLQFTAGVNNEFGFSGLEFLPRINKVELRVSFPWDEDTRSRYRAAPDPETWQKIREEAGQEQRCKKGELKKKIQAQLALAGNTNEPILTVD